MSHRLHRNNVPLGSKLTDQSPGQLMQIQLLGTQTKLIEDIVTPWTDLKIIMEQQLTISGQTSF